MKVNIGPYRHHYSFWSFINRRLKWLNDDQLCAVDDFMGDWKIVNAWFKFLNWITGSTNDRNVKIHIDDYDVWGMDHTISMIIHPMLVKLRESKQGSPLVNNEDLPESLHSVRDEDGHDDLIHEKWTWVLDEMIWTFGEIAAGKDSSDMIVYPEDYNLIDMFKPTDGGYFEYVPDPEREIKVIRPLEEMKAYDDRRANGLRLFAKYFHSLWD